MTAAGIEFERVRKGKGRVHLTPRIPKDGPVATLCGKTLTAGEYERTDTEADCQSCRRRSNDAGLVSGAFFESDAGMALLELSLAQSKTRPRPPSGTGAPAKAARATGVAHARPEASAPRANPRGKSTGADAKTAARPRRPAPTVEVDDAVPPKPPPGVPGLECKGLKMLSATQMESPLGVLLRVRDAGGTWEVAELDFEGPVHVGRSGGRFKLRIGDVTLTLPPPAQRRP